MRLAVLVLACVLPVWAGSGYLTYHSYQAKRSQVERQMLDTAHMVGLSIDREMVGVRAALEALATSPSLRQKDFAGFYQQSRLLLNGYPQNSNILLADRAGQQLVNTFLPYGHPLPRRNNAQAVEKVFHDSQPFYSDLFIGSISGKPYVGVDVPVLGEHEVLYDLAAVIPTTTLDKVLSMARLPDHWIGAVLDSKGILAARTLNSQQFVGKLSTPRVLNLLEEHGGGIVEGPNFEGEPSVFVAQRSAETNFAIVLVVPLEMLNAELRQWMMWSVLGGGALSILGLALAMGIAGSIASSIQSLVAAAEALGRDEEPLTQASGLKEADEVAAALHNAHVLLTRREQERQSAVGDLAESNRLLAGSNADLEQFAYVASHDLRQPLRMVASYVSLLERRYADQLDAEAHEFIGFATQGAKRMDRLIVDLLDYSRIGRQERPMEQVAIAEVLDEAARNLGPALEDCGGKVLLPAQAPMLWGNREELVRLFQNLIGNGLKYHSPNRSPVVEVSCDGKGGEWQIAVNDNGIGIEPAYFDRIFGIFQRLHTESAYDGTGIGLAVCRKVAEHHGGFITVSSEPGLGSRFTVVLPQSA
jgi:signal transduction histidine kinase